MEVKPWWQSKTILVNGLAIAVAVATAALGVKELPEVDPVIVTSILGAVNIGLRLITSAALR